MSKTYPKKYPVFDEFLSSKWAYLDGEKVSRTGIYPKKTYTIFATKKISGENATIEWLWCGKKIESVMVDFWQVQLDGKFEALPQELKFRVKWLYENMPGHFRIFLPELVKATN